VTAAVVQREVAEGRTFVGTVLPSRRSVIGSAVEGRVLDLKVNDGDWVKEGDTLAELRTVTIKLELEAAQAELEVRKHALDESKSSLPVEKQQAQAALARTQAVSAYAKARLTRAEALFAKGGTTSQEELEQNRSVSLAARPVGARGSRRLPIVAPSARREDPAGGSSSGQTGGRSPRGSRTSWRSTRFAPRSTVM